MRSIVIVTFALSLVVGCGSPKPAMTPSAHPAMVGQPASSNSGGEDKEGVIVTPDSTMNGKVALVNANARYVVVSFPIGAMPSVGKVMAVYRNGLKVGEIKITGPQRDFDTVADLVNGSSQVGDEIREN